MLSSDVIRLIFGSLFVHPLVVFAITMVVTKSTLFGCKRKYVIDRYEHVKKFGRPGIIHRIWHAAWTCSMCSGMWFSAGTIPLVYPSRIVGFAPDWKSGVCLCLTGFAINWLLHLTEDKWYAAGRAAGTAGRA